MVNEESSNRLQLRLYFERKKQKNPNQQIYSDGSG